MSAHRRTSWPASLRFLLVVQGGVLVVAALHFGQPVLLPLMITVLLTFLLRPAVVWLERVGVARAVAVSLVALGVLLAIGSAMWIVTAQFRDLAVHLDEYRGHLHAKVDALRQTRLQ